MRRTLVPLLTLLLCSAARADGLADVRAALAKFPAREGLRATVSLESTSKGDDDEKPNQGRGSVDVEKGADGVRVLYAADTMSRAQQETRASQLDPEKQKPTVTALRALDAIAIVEALDGASVLSHYLDSAKLTKDIRLGNGIRQLTFAVTPRLSKSDAKKIKTAEVTLIVNLGGDGIPVSAEMKQLFKAKFLLMTFEQNGQETWTFGRAGDHLVAVRHHEVSSGSGMGQKFSSTITTTVAVR